MIRRLLSPQTQMVFILLCGASILVLALRDIPMWSWALGACANLWSLLLASSTRFLPHLLLLAVALWVAVRLAWAAVLEFRAARRWGQFLRMHPARQRAANLIELESDEIFACTAGLLNPQTYVSSALVRSLDASAYAAVLAHEAHHRRMRDPLVMTLWRVCAFLFGLLPLVRPLVRDILTARECDADHAAIEQGATPSHLLAAMRVLTTPAAGAQSPVASFTLGPDHAARIRRLAGMGERRPSYGWAMLLTALVLTVLLAPVLTPHTQASVLLRGGRCEVPAIPQSPATPMSSDDQPTLPTHTIIRFISQE